MDILRKKVLSAFLVMLMIWTMAATPLFAASSDAETENEVNVEESAETSSETEIPVTESSDYTETSKNAQEETDTETAVDQGGEALTEEATGTLSFIYLEQGTVTAPDTQIVAMAASDESRMVQHALLTYTTSLTGEEKQVEAQTIAGNAFSFAIAHTETTASYTVTLTSLQYSYTDAQNAEAVECVISLTDELSAAYDVYPDEAADESGMSVYTIDEDGNAVAADSIEEALEQAGADADTVSQNENAITIGGVSRSRSNVSTTSTAGTAHNWNDKSEGLVVALDPGHDASHTGATGNGLREEDINLKIALACKAELETYDGVEVIMTRSTAACPYPGTTSTQDNTNRVKTAYAAGADVYIAFHMNSAGASAKGALIIAQNTSWKPAIAQEGSTLGDKILTQLASLGITRRTQGNNGVTTKDSTNGGTYPDGSVADYYTISCVGKELGIPAIFIEHAFLTNSEDAAFFSSDANIEQVGIADATAIAQEYGLEKDDGKVKISGFSVVPNELNGNLTMTATGVRPYARIKTVKFAVWKATEKVVWLDAEKKSQGTFGLTYSLKDYNDFEDGDYYVDVYGYDDDGNPYYLTGTSKTLTNRHLSVTVTQKSSTWLTITATMSSVPSDLTNLKFAVWSEKGNNDLKWLPASGSGTTRIANVDLSQYAGFGKFYIDTYAVSSSGLTWSKSDTYTLSEPSGNIAITNQDSETGSYDIVLSDVSCVTGISKLVVAVWNQSSDLKWMTLTKESDGTYTAHVSSTDHEKRDGTYYNDVYLTDARGQTCYLTGKNCSVSFKKPVLNAERADSTGKYTFTVSNTDISAGSSLQIAVWHDGQAVSYYEAVKDSSGNYAVTKDMASHRYYGNYYADAYVKSADGTMTYLCSTMFQIVPTATVSVSGITAGAMSVKLSIALDYAPFGYQSLSVASWPEGAGVLWDSLSYTSESTRNLVVDIAKMSRYSGKFYSDVYLKDQTGTNYYIGGVNYTIEETENTPSVKANPADGDAAKEVLTASGVSLASGEKLSFAVWNEGGSVKWFTASKNAAGQYVYTADLKSFGRYGTYYVDCYRISAAGTYRYFAGTTFAVEAPSAACSFGEVASGATKADFTVSNISAKLGYTGLKVYTWPESGALRCTEFTKNASGTYTVTVDSAALGFTNGVYYADVYLCDSTGGTYYLCGSKVTLTSSLYPIMGTSTTTVKQMVNLYNAMGQAYPSAVLSTGGAATIETFCQIYYEEAAAEGVRAEVAFCQAMLETGWLQYGGDVKVTQFNFAGLGATGNGVPGNSFPDVRTGIRAQIQHLKAYASTDALNNTCVDQRFSYVTRGCAPYLEWLGIKENPNGYGWATGERYGAKIRAIITNLLSTSKK